ncbi:hypothetical protein BDB00DRAFT_880652 [Zychaea mexicana]|uniref:uncharacterized protein n=1 Tax=Zychaea mexicana TaxID=64656 RepID=UPI0022FE2B8C|nr:uncharacterized protein BDB00DRAFT_880652 [Zychaea mexicana]KAI9466439.1 hypothetical protein BDB00DRAFT_880652 [Zychaea mexicana]
MLKPNPTAINNVIAPGFVINDQIEAFYKQLVPLLVLTWQTKAAVKKTLKALKDDQTVFIPTPHIPTLPSVIPPCPPSPRPVSKGKKRKSPEEDDD